MSKPNSTPNLTVVSGGSPYFVEKLEELLRKARSGELRGVAIASLDSEDNVYADWVKAPGTTVLELLGAASMLVSKLDRDMRGV